MQTTTRNHYTQIQQQIETLNEIELIEVIDFINSLHQKRTYKQPNQKTIDAMEAAERGEYETVSLDDLRQQWNEA
ncbi:MAG: DUF2281 domain-containing protein [Methylococcaceae bacterium]